MNFQNITNNLRTPLFFAEFDNSQANTATATQRTLIIGQTLTLAGVTVDIPVIESSASNTAGVYGAGSMLHNQMLAYLANDNAGEIYLLPLADSDAMVAATGKVTVTTPANETGVISLYIAGQRVQITVLSTDLIDAIATALSAAINAKTSLPVTARAALRVVSLTAKSRRAHRKSTTGRVNHQASD